jgi:hypothetical protein
VVEIPIELTKRYLRVRINPPSKYIKFRTHDIGAKGHSKRIAGMTKEGEWETQAFLINREDLEKGRKQEVELVEKLIATLPKRKAEKLYKIYKRLRR